MRKLKSKFNIWADGSFEKSASLMGVGYLIYDGKKQLYAQGGKSFERTNQSNSTISELLSCTTALAELPDGCNIKIHSDCAFVVDHIQNNKSSHPDASLNTALTDLFNEIARHEKVTAVKEHEQGNFYLKQAHNYSVAARNHQM